MSEQGKNRPVFESMSIGDKSRIVLHTEETSWGDELSKIVSNTDDGEIILKED